MIMNPIDPWPLLESVTSHWTCQRNMYTPRYQLQCPLRCLFNDIYVSSQSQDNKPVSFGIDMVLASRCSVLSHFISVKTSFQITNTEKLRVLLY